MVSPASALAAIGAASSAGAVSLAPASGASAEASAGAGASPSSPSTGRPSALRRSRLRRRRCSGTSAMVLLAALERSGDAAVLADAPEMDGHEDHDDERQHQHVEHVPPQQRVVA